MAKARFPSKNKSNYSKRARVVGDVRQTQLITSYGIGSIIDFVRDTVIIAGTDDWDNDRDTERLESRKLYNENLQSMTGVKYFLAPKVEQNKGWVKSKDIPAFTFPEMLYCPKCKRFVTSKEAFNANPTRPDVCCLSDASTKKKCTGKLVASRFVVACENGHIEDFPYSWWIHRNTTCSSTKPPRITMYNVGNRSDIDSLWVKCENCNKARPMSGAFSEYALGGENSYLCRGNHPHLKSKRQHGEPSCDKILKTRLRSSSSIYYPVTLNALQIPPWSRDAVKIVERNYEALSHMGDNALIFLQSKVTSKVSHEQLLVAYDIVKRRKDSDIERSVMQIYFDEYSVLVNGTTNNDEGDFSAFSAEIPLGFEQIFDQITVVDKLTVIEALTGFTRLTPAKNDKEERKLAPLSTYPKDWLPATELRGEGIFIHFRKNIVNQWKKGVGKRYNKMKAELSNSFMSTRLDRFSPEYVLLHTFCHMLIRQLSAECGYSAASIKEKIYSTFHDSKNKGKDMYGVLIYLASSDSDGSLGGLISIAQDSVKLGKILNNMIQKAQWCSADPLCATSQGQGYHSLNYAACHDCVLLPETSCEFRNVLLDRASVVGFVENPEIGLFTGEWDDVPVSHILDFHESISIVQTSAPTIIESIEKPSDTIVKTQQPKTFENILSDKPQQNEPQHTKIPAPPKSKDKVIFSENINTLEDARILLVKHNEYKAIFGQDILDLVTTLDAYKHHSEIAAEVIKKLFPPPQMAYDKFMGELMDSDATFLRLICKGADIIGIAVKRTTKRDEILGKIKEDARSLAELCDDLAAVLINKYGNNSVSDESAKEVDNLLLDLQVLIESVKNYS